MTEPIVFVRKMQVPRHVLMDPDLLGRTVAQLRAMLAIDITQEIEGRGYTIHEIELSVDDSEAQMQITVSPID